MFPPEIIDHILSFLQWDHATLKVCARAHPSLSSLVKKHFYRHLTVQNYDPCPAGAYHPSDLLKLFVDEPSIANLFRSLRINVDFHRDYQALESILPMLTQLQSISLSASITSIIWDNLRESFRIAFANYLRLPTLTDVNLSNINRFPLSALDHSSSLKGLSLKGYFISLPPSSPLVYPPLDFLDLYICSSRSIEVITSWVESRSLPVRSLKLGSNLNQRLLGLCANTLTNLSLVFRFHYYTDIPLSLSCLPHLAQLTVQSNIFLDESLYAASLPPVMRFLNTLPSPPTSLVLLIINLDIFIGDDTDIPDTDWSPIISFPYFDTIPSIELRVNAPNSPPETPLVELLKQDRHLKQLERHRSFVIKAEDQDCSS